MTMIKSFLNDETGAVTIDWVALTAGILLLGIAVVYAIFSGGVTPLVTNINETLSTASLGVVNTSLDGCLSAGGGTC